MVSPTKSFPFFQNGQPGETSLIDLKDEAFEEKVIIPQREAVFVIVIGTVERVPGCKLTIGTHTLNLLWG
jgi:hypothetical protein